MHNGTVGIKQPSHGKLKLASSICRQQFANLTTHCFCAVHTHQLEFANLILS